jgi:hypothetical protein
VPQRWCPTAGDLAANASHGVVNRISDVKLLLGDLAEAWREAIDPPPSLRFALSDQTTTAPAAGDRGRPEATEVDLRACAAVLAGVGNQQT